MRYETTYSKKEISGMPACNFFMGVKVNILIR
jgi:hypothetical protein